MKKRLRVEGCWLRDCTDDSSPLSSPRPKRRGRETEADWEAGSFEENGGMRLIAP
jgi:hypothetical protein